MRKSALALRWASAVLALLLAACSPLQPVDLPPESAPAPTENTLWSTLETTRQDEWYALLNEGARALDWRLQAIDAATQTIDLHLSLFSLLSMLPVSVFFFRLWGLQKRWQ